MMKKFTFLTNFTAVFLLLAASAAAADLRNEDGRRYEVRIHESSTTRNTWIDGNSTALSICGSCEIEVVGLGKIRLSGAERAIIKNGKLFKQ
jgi:hypothetical protein